jgi:molybdate transport system regulatory protein
MAKPTAATGAETLTASFMLQRGALARVGAERIALLEAIGEHGSISAAAKAVGLSYKGAWDAVQALNNLFDQPLVLTRAGGRQGGEATLSPRGAEAIQGFRSVEAELARLAATLDEGGSARRAPLASLIWSLGMRTSARNALKGVVEAVKDGAVNAEVALRIGDEAVITAIITRESVRDLGLAAGVQAIALIKSSFVILARGAEGLRTSARNQLPGEVVRREDGAVNSEISLAIGGGKTITATITCESANALDLKPGEPAIALIKASHVILAVE